MEWNETGRLTKERIESIVKTFNKTKSYKETGRIEGVDWKTVKVHLPSTQDTKKQAAERPNDVAAVQTPAAPDGYTLFAKGAQPLHVAIALRSDAPTVERWWTEYWRLIGLNDLYTAYTKLGPGQFESFVQLANLMTSEGISPAEMLDYLHDIGSIKKVPGLLAEKNRVLSDLDFKILMAQNKLHDLEGQVGPLEQRLNTLEQRTDLPIWATWTPERRKAHLELYCQHLRMKEMFPQFQEVCSLMERNLTEGIEWRARTTQRELTKPSAT
jgi:hypothetical protein